MEVISICLVEQLDDQGSQLFCWWVCFLKDRQPDPGNHGILAHWRKTGRQLQWRKTSGTFRSCSASQIVAFESGNEDISFFFEFASMENTAPLNRCLSNSAECNNYSFRMIQIISNHSKSIWPKTGMVIKTAQVTELPSPPGEVDSSWSSSLPPGSPWLQLCHSTKTHVGGLRSRVASDAWTAWRMDGTMEDHGRSWKMVEGSWRWFHMLKESSKFMARKSLEKSQSLNMDFFLFPDLPGLTLWDSPSEACDLHLRVGLRSAFLETIPCSASKGLSWGPEGSRPFRRSPCIRWSHWQV